MFCLILIILIFSRRWYWHGYGPYNYYGAPYASGYPYNAYPYGAYSYYDPYWRQARYYGYRGVHQPYNGY